MLENKEGQNIPNVIFKVREGNEFKDVSTDDIFANKTVVFFALPGAFTPTCSSSHLPRYNELFYAFKENGVDLVVCLSVNDTFVMNEWKRQQNCPNITFLPDGNCDFTENIGMAVDKNDLGFGRRSWRYSMLVKNKKIEKMFIEPNKPGDPFEVSDADTMLSYINPNFKLKPSISMFVRPGCPFCAKAEKLLKENGFDFEEIVLGKDASVQSMRAITGRTSTPQVFINGKHIGGSDDLEKYLKNI